MKSPELPERSDSAKYALLGITPPSQQKTWRDDGEWLEFGPCDNLDDYGNLYRVVGGADELDKEYQEATVLLTSFSASNGRLTQMEFPPEVAREIGALLIERADEAEAEMEKPFSSRRTVDYLMEKLRAAFHRRELRRKLKKAE